MERITDKFLDAVVLRLNRATGMPETVYQPHVPGKPAVVNVGNFHLAKAYGGVSLHQVVNDGGGIDDIFSVGFVSKRELAGLIHAFLKGFDLGRNGGEV